LLHGYNYIPYFARKFQLGISNLNNSHQGTKAQKLTGEFRGGRILVMPKVIIYNSISLDGSLTGFVPNMELHYKLAAEYKPQAHLIGSHTVKAGIEMFSQEVPPEEKSDFEKPKRSELLPYWVVVDSRGILQGLHHTSRRFEFCRDVIVLVSKTTPQSYLEHLKERNYDYHVVGDDHVDLKAALELLAKKYQVEVVVTDTGKILSNLLLEQGLVNEISLLVHPLIVGEKAYRIFDNISKGIELKLVRSETLDKQVVLLVYEV
jgi:2,5-diamino-6-(ribosylamino)-4(3H)-pyrimidinone 5'-phosphate reductase